VSLRTVRCRTNQELKAAANDTRRPDDDTQLIEIPDNQLHLITPASDDDGQQVGYQLTHDYLVPSLQDWLTRKQRETRRGRAELQLNERAELWHAKRENRQLPLLWKILNIRARTNARF
jgi:hypothetical protein